MTNQIFVEVKILAEEEIVVTIPREIDQVEVTYFDVFVDAMEAWPGCMVRILNSEMKPLTGWSMG
jgi:hypothetical protein